MTDTRIAKAKSFALSVKDYNPSDLIQSTSIMIDWSVEVNQILVRKFGLETVVAELNTEDFTETAEKFKKKMSDMQGTKP